LIVASVRFADVTIYGFSFKIVEIFEFLVHTAENKKKLNEEIKQKFGAFKENCFPRPSGGMKRTTAQRPSQNVRDPVRERAQANYAAVVNELNEKFKGLKEGCFPRPKGEYAFQCQDVINVRR
uniref:Uncharacterized protein n=1 Tax=Parascaris equorum TaxID=6256 RepID=A0A914R910_PAREQ